MESGPFWYYICQKDESFGLSWWYSESYGREVIQISH